MLHLSKELWIPSENIRREWSIISERSLQRFHIVFLLLDFQCEISAWKNVWLNINCYQNSQEEEWSEQKNFSLGPILELSERFTRSITINDFSIVSHKMTFVHSCWHHILQKSMSYLTPGVLHWLSCFIISQTFLIATLEQATQSISQIVFNW